MIKVNVKKHNDVIEKVIVKGHAGYAESGADIVCASVSSIVITSVNAIISVDETSISVNERDGFIEIIKINNNELVNKLLINLVNMLEQLALDYPKNILMRNEGIKK